MTPWKRLAKWRPKTNFEARMMALDNVLKHGAPLTIQEVRRALGMKSKSSLYEKCWRDLIDMERACGRIVWSTRRLHQTDDAASTSPRPSSSA